MILNIATKINENTNENIHTKKKHCKYKVDFKYVEYFS